MISDDSIKAVINFADLYSKKGYKKELVHDEKTNKYELSWWAKLTSWSSNCSW
jgi:hypothetical protein